MTVGVDAFIASWCKIFKPESHLAASSLESAGGVNEHKAVAPWEGLCFEPWPRASSAPQTAGMGHNRAVSTSEEGHLGVIFTPSWA